MLADSHTLTASAGGAGGAVDLGGPTYETVADANGADNADDYYANTEVTAAPALALAAARSRMDSTGAGIDDQNNIYDMKAPQRRRTNSAGTGGTAAAKAAGKAKGERCARPSPSGGQCKNRALKGSFFCNGHTCPIPECTAGKSTKMATCPDHVHGAGGFGGGGGGGGGRAALPHPESGEVFYDSVGPAVIAAAAAGANASARSAPADIYTVPSKGAGWLKKPQQQAAFDANATYATPIRPVPEEDYVALDEMPSNDEASLMYAVPTPTPAASAGGAAVPVPEPTKVGTGTVVLGAASACMDESSSDDEELDC